MHDSYLLQRDLDGIYWFSVTMLGWFRSWDSIITTVRAFINLSLVENFNVYILKIVDFINLVSFVF